MARKFDGREVFIQPSNLTAKNGMGSGPVPLGQFRRKTLEIAADSDMRPEIPPSYQKDGRKA